MYRNPMADLGSGVQNNVWKQADIIPHNTVCAEVITAYQNGASTQTDSRPNHATRSDMGGGRNLGRLRDDRTRMYAAGILFGRKKNGEETGQRDARIRHANQHFLRSGTRTGYQNSRGLRLLSGSEIRGGFGKSEFARL